MPKIRNVDTRGLVQESGRGVTFEQAGLVITRDYVEATVDTANGTTTTDCGISLPANCRIIAYKVSVIAVTGTPAGNITDLGFKAGDVDAIMDGVTLSASALGSNQGQSATLSATSGVNATPTTELMLTHDDPGAASRSSKVKVVVYYETIA